MKISVGVSGASASRVSQPSRAHLAERPAVAAVLQRIEADDPQAQRRFDHIVQKPAVSRNDLRKSAEQASAAIVIADQRDDRAGAVLQHLRCLGEALQIAVIGNVAR